jgi:hypothetical protein
VNDETPSQLQFKTATAVTTATIQQSPKNSAIANKMDEAQQLMQSNGKYVWSITSTTGVARNAR